MNEKVWIHGPKKEASYVKRVKSKSRDFVTLKPDRLLRTFFPLSSDTILLRALVQFTDLEVRLKVMMGYFHLDEQYSLVK